MLSDRPLIEEFANFVRRMRIAYELPVAPQAVLVGHMMYGDAVTPAEDFIDFYLEDAALTFLSRKIFVQESRRVALAMAEHYNAKARCAEDELVCSNRPDEPAITFEIQFHHRLMHENNVDAKAFSEEIERIKARLDDLKKFSIGIKMDMALT